MLGLMSRSLQSLGFIALVIGFATVNACSSGDGSFRGNLDASYGQVDAPSVPLPDGAANDASDSGADAGTATDASTDADSDALYATSFFLDWTIEDVGPPINDMISCEEAGTTGLTIAATNTATGSVKTFSFACSSQKGVQLPLAPGPYSLAVRLMRADNVEVSSIVIPMQLGNTGVTDIGGVVFEIQSFATRWSVTRTAAPGVPVSCPSVGASQVEFTATTSGLAPFVFRFACGDGMGLTQAVPDGTYALQYRLLDAGGNTMSQVSNANYSTPVNAQAVLAPVTFTVN